MGSVEENYNRINEYNKFFFKTGICFFREKRKQPCISLSHVGKRLNHEDNFLLDEYFITSTQQKKICGGELFIARSNCNSKVKLFAVSDGMGGHNAGEIASRICMEELAKTYKELQYSNSLNEAIIYLRNKIVEINDIICKFSQITDAYKGMGATLLILILFETKCAILNIGDSRAYYYENNKLLRITKDHTVGQRILDSKVLTEKEYSFFPHRKALERYMGFERIGYSLKADEYYLEPHRGIILLCSDGISDFISDMRICEILSKRSDIEETGKKIVNEAINKHDSDNATLILVPFGR